MVVAIRSETIGYVAISALTVIVLLALWKLFQFAERHPQVAILEGSEYIAYEQIQLAQKGVGTLPLRPQSRRRSLLIFRQPSGRHCNSPTPFTSNRSSDHPKIMADLLSVFIRPKLGVSQAQVEQKLDLAIDWFRYADGCYLVYTSKQIKTWCVRLHPFVDPGGHLLLLDVDPHDYNGWMPKDLWPWLEDKKKKMYGEKQLCATSNQSMKLTAGSLAINF